MTQHYESQQRLAWLIHIEIVIGRGHHFKTNAFSHTKRKGIGRASIFMKNETFSMLLP